jgi:hypothetical protein
VRLEHDSRRSARALATTVEAASAAHEARDAADLGVARLEAALASERGAFEAGLAAADGAVEAQVAAVMREVMGMRGQLTSESGRRYPTSLTPRAPPHAPLSPSGGRKRAPERAQRGPQGAGARRRRGKEGTRTS